MMTVVEREDYRPDAVSRRPLLLRLSKSVLRSLSFVKGRNQDNHGDNEKKSRKISFDAATIVSTASSKPALLLRRLDTSRNSPATTPASLADNFFDQRRPKEILLTVQGATYPFLDKTRCRDDVSTASLPSREDLSSLCSVSTAVQSVRSIVSTTTADSLKASKFEMCQRSLSHDQLCDLNSQRHAFRAALAARAIYEENLATAAEMEAHTRALSRWQKGQCARIIIVEPDDDPIQAKIESEIALQTTPIENKPTACQERDKTGMAQKHCKNWMEPRASRSPISLSRLRRNPSQRQLSVSQIILTQRTQAESQNTDPALVARLQAFQLQKNIFGSSHPDVLFAMNNLGNAYRKRGHQEEADRICEEAKSFSHGSIDSVPA